MNLSKYFCARVGEFTGRICSAPESWGWAHAVLSEAQRNPLRELFELVPLADCWVSFIIKKGRAYPYSEQTESAEGGIVRAFGFLTPEQIRKEVTETDVGQEALTHGLIPIGICSKGSGDLYSLKFDPDEQMYRNELWLVSWEGSSPFDDLWYDAHCYVPSLKQIVTVLTIHR